MDSSKVLRNASVAEFYGGKNVLITGATGFMGKVLVEKLLRDCGQVKCIYILVRMKRGVDPYERHENYVKDIIFDRVREAAPGQLTKIRLIKGDISQDNMDIDPDDEAELVNHVNIIFHCAAKAKFSLTLREALLFNTCGTLRVLQLAEKAKNLLVYSHYSTAYCCPSQTSLEEAYYPAPEDPYTVIKLLNSPRAKDLDEIEPRLMKGYPNTYALSKLMAEDLAHSFRHKFPIIITRPSLVTPAWQEPFPGYVESKKNGLMGSLMTRGRGVMRTILADPDLIFEMIPVDIANNAIIALTAKRGLMSGSEILYSNLSNSGIHKWTTGQYYDFEMEICKQFPLDLLLWYPYCPVTKHRWYYELRRILYHYFPALVGDISCVVFGRKPKILLHMRKIDKGMNTLSFYLLRKYDWKNDTLKNLPKELCENEQDKFFCDFKEIDMYECAQNSVLGARKYILNIRDEDSLEFRRGLVTLFWHIDLYARIFFTINLLICGLLIFGYIFNYDYFSTLVVDVYYSAKFLVSNNLVIRRGVIAMCNRS